MSRIHSLKVMMLGLQQNLTFKSLDTALCVKIILILPESDLEFKRSAVKIGCLYKKR